MEVRLQKLIARAGVTSRRKAEELITSGCVTVNGRIITELGSKADPDRDHVKVNGKLLRMHPPSVCIMLNKPKEFITSLKDPEGRPTVMELVRGVKGRFFPIGRLDYHTEGLLLLTNDGELANLLMHPRHGVSKCYEVKVKGQLEDEEIQRLARGVRLDPSTRPTAPRRSSGQASGRGLARDSAGRHDGTTAPCTIKKIGKAEKNSWLEVTLHEGRYRQVRRMFESAGHFVLRLRRVGYGGLTLGDLPVGRCRRLTDAEIATLRRAAAGQTGGQSRPAMRGRERRSP